MESWTHGLDALPVLNGNSVERFGPVNRWRIVADVPPS